MAGINFDSLYTYVLVKYRGQLAHIVDTPNNYTLCAVVLEELGDCEGAEHPTCVACIAHFDSFCRGFVRRRPTWQFPVWYPPAPNTLPFMRR